MSGWFGGMREKECGRKVRNERVNEPNQAWHKNIMVQNNQESRCKYWANRSSVRSFPLTTHLFAYSALLASLCRAPLRSFTHWIPSLWKNEWWLFLNDGYFCCKFSVLDRSALVKRMRDKRFSNNVLTMTGHVLSQAYLPKKNHLVKKNLRLCFVSMKRTTLLLSLQISKLAGKRQIKLTHWRHFLCYRNNCMASTHKSRMAKQTDGRIHF